MDLATWNLNGLEEATAVERAERAAMVILLGRAIEAVAAGAPPRPPPDVILLQEVTATTWAAALRPHLRAAGFHLFPDAPPDRTHFEACAVRSPWSVLGYEASPLWRSQYGRWQHVLDLTGPEGGCRVMTAHLDSGPEPATARIRSAQIADLAAQLGAGPAVFAGDTNLRDREVPEARLEELGVWDAWDRAGRPAGQRFTWFGGARQARFDRAYGTSGIEVLGFETMGARGDPSDHLGLRLSLRLP